jgi:hypothetical protein
MNTVLSVWLALCLAIPTAASAQSVLLSEADSIHRSRDTSQPTDLPKPAVVSDSAIPRVIVIGFVGGFARRDDLKHPEVQFAAHLRDRYPSLVHAEVFSNHQGQDALRQVVGLLDADHDGSLTPAEKEQAKIILYGHSWGASETVAFAKELGQKGIPVLLTVQLDSIKKPGQRDSTIPPNVANAVNFYQPGGLLHGRREISAADPASTRIIGNFRMTYKNHPINCDNYPWLARTFNKPHHEIENDPRVWSQVASLIDSELWNKQSAATTSLSNPAPDPTAVIPPRPLSSRAQ